MGLGLGGLGLGCMGVASPVAPTLSGLPVLSNANGTISVVTAGRPVPPRWGWGD